MALSDSLGLALTSRRRAEGAATGPFSPRGKEKELGATIFFSLPLAREKGPVRRPCGEWEVRAGAANSLFAADPSRTAPTVRA